MRYLKATASIVMFFTLFQAIRGQYLFHTTTEYHTPLVAQTIGTMALTGFACLIFLISAWNYKQIERKTA